MKPWHSFLSLYLSYCIEEILSLRGESLTDPGIICEGQKTTLTCSLNRSPLHWEYSGQAIGQPVTRTNYTYTITISVLGHFFDKSVNKSYHGFLQSSLSFATALSMNGKEVKCAGPGINFTKTLHVLPKGALPNISRPTLIAAVPGRDSYSTTLKWTIEGGSGIPVIVVLPPVSSNFLQVDDTSPFSLTINVSTSYNKHYSLHISSSNCNGKSSKRFELFKVGFCGHPPPPPFGGGVEPIKARYDQDEVVTYYCQNKKLKIHHMTSKCTLDGTWSPNQARFHCFFPSEPSKWYIGLIAALAQVVLILIGALVAVGIICFCAKFAKKNGGDFTQVSTSRRVHPLHTVHCMENDGTNNENSGAGNHFVRQSGATSEQSKKGHNVAIQLPHKLGVGGGIGRARHTSISSKVEKGSSERDMSGKYRRQSDPGELNAHATNSNKHTALNTRASIMVISNEDLIGLELSDMINRSEASHNILRPQDDEKQGEDKFSIPGLEKTKAGSKGSQARHSTSSSKLSEEKRHLVSQLTPDIEKGDEKKKSLVDGILPSTAKNSERNGLGSQSGERKGSLNQSIQSLGKNEERKSLWSHNTQRSTGDSGERKGLLGQGTQSIGKSEERRSRWSHTTKQSMGNNGERDGSLGQDTPSIGKSEERKSLRSHITQQSTDNSRDKSNSVTHARGSTSNIEDRKSLWTQATQSTGKSRKRKDSADHAMPSTGNNEEKRSLWSRSTAKSDEKSLVSPFTPNQDDKEETKPLHQHVPSSNQAAASIDNELGTGSQQETRVPKQKTKQKSSGLLKKLKRNKDISKDIKPSNEVLSTIESNENALGAASLDLETIEKGIGTMKWTSGKTTLLNEKVSSQELETSESGLKAGTEAGKKSSPKKKKVKKAGQATASKLNEKKKN